MLTAGLDLAAEPKGTALALISWSPAGAKVVELTLGVADEQVIETALRADKLGIDCALGWPLQFIEFLNQYANLTESKTVFDGDMSWRRQVSYRESDRHVRAVTGRWPLSVSTDRLGLTAMRAAGLLSKMQHEQIEIDRTGTGLVVEIYPGASLRIWGFETTNYRTSPELRQRLISDLKTAASWLELGSFETLMIESCDAFDAVIAALAARAAAIGAASEPPKNVIDVAKIEGWIHLPTKALVELLEI